MFAGAGSIGYLVDVGVLLLANPYMGPYLGRLLSFSAAVLTTWLINRTITFQRVRVYASVHHEFIRYLITCLGGGVVNLVSYSLVVGLFELTTAWLPIAVAVGSLSGMSVNFLLAKHFVFSNPKEMLNVHSNK